VLPEGSGDDAYVMGTQPEVESTIWEEDWSMVPSAFKVYLGLAPIALPDELQHTTLPALEVISAGGSGGTGTVSGKATVGQIARLSNGLFLNQDKASGAYFTTGGGMGRFKVAANGTLTAVDHDSPIARIANGKPATFLTNAVKSVN
jgi:hypothetical protein